MASRLTFSSIGQYARTIVFHDLFDHLRTAHDPFAFRNQIRLGHVEEVEIRGAAIEFDAGAMGVPDEIVDGLGRALLDHELLGDALFHQLTGGRRADHLDVTVRTAGTRSSSAASVRLGATSS